ncbi:hypothetical protein ACSVDA_09550 [Cytobacillus sp. Hm23]
MNHKIRVLEIRLNDRYKDYPALYHYKDIDREQIFVRRECEYYVKDGIVYEQVSSALEDDRFVLYVNKIGDDTIDPNTRVRENLCVEVREYRRIGEQKLLKIYDCRDHMDVLGYIGNTFIYIEGKEYKRSSVEADEDRQTYILYVNDTGTVLE